MADKRGVVGSFDSPPLYRCCWYCYYGYYYTELWFNWPTVVALLQVRCGLPHRTFQNCFIRFCSVISYNRYDTIWYDTIR